MTTGKVYAIIYSQGWERKEAKTMMNIYEYFNKLYSKDFDKAQEIENMVWNWYNNDEEKFDQWVEDNNIELYDVIEMMDGQEYAINLWVWDMED